MNVTHEKRRAKGLCYNCNVGKYRNDGVCRIHGSDLRGG